MTAGVPPSGNPIRVVIAEDHLPSRRAIREALESGGCEVCGEAATADAAIRLVADLDPDVALLDIHMPGDGIAAAATISERSRRTAVVMLTNSSAEQDLFAALQAGAVGYVLKDTDPDGLATALRSVLDGEAVMPQRLVARVLEHFRSAASAHKPRKSKVAERLSPRELEIMQLLAQGYRTEDVAQTLFISTTTVRVHVSTVLKKLHVNSRAAAIKALEGTDR